MPGIIDLTGQRYSRLVVLEQAGLDNKGKLCRCDCGQTCVVPSRHLRSGNTTSCGCFRRDFMRTVQQGSHRHGHTSRTKVSPEYVSWHGMNTRCRNPRYKHYRLYGGRGIRVEFASFEEFLAHVGPRPPGHSIDRIDPDGNYCIGNVRWADAKTQNTNQRRHRSLTP
jgi:hypothetical protein